MKSLCIVEKLMTMGSKFDVYDKRGYQQYYIQGDKVDLGSILTIYSCNRREKLMYIKKDKRHKEFYYKLYDKNNIIVAEVRKIPNQYEYEIKGSLGEYKITSVSIIDRGFSINKGNEKVGSITKNLSLSRDNYILEFDEDENEILLIALVIIIDMIRFYTE